MITAVTCELGVPINVEKIRETVDSGRIAHFRAWLREAITAATLVQNHRFVHVLGANSPSAGR
jgi:hypothetical protein